MPITPTSLKSKNYQALGIDEIADDIETVFTAVNATDASLVALEAEVNAIPTPPTTTTVNISAGQLKSGDPIDLFAIPNGKYLRSLELFLIYTEGATPYTLTGTYVPIIDFNSGNLFINLHREIFDYWVTQGVPVVNSYVWSANSNIGNAIAINTGITGGHLTGGVDNKVIFPTNSLLFADGNGTLQVICTYTFLDI